MIMAIAAIVVIAGIMTISLSITSQTSKRTTDIYLYEQAALYSKSAAEFALLQIANAAPCSIPFINTTFGDNVIANVNNIYDVNITLQYIYSGNIAADSPCFTALGVDYTQVQTDEQNGSVLMDIAVTVDDPTITSEPIRYFRRTIQKL